MWWFIYGFFLGSLITGLAVASSIWSFAISWYVWLIGILALILISITLQHYFASIRELEPTPAKRGALIMGIPALILVAVAILLAI